MSVEGSRFNLMDTAILAPGVDFVTKSPVGPFVDTGYTLNFMEWKSGSRVYHSVSTVREMADVAGLFDELREEIEAARQEGYDRGYGDGLKENFNGDIADAVDRLGFIADVLTSYQSGRVAVVPVAVAPEGAGDGTGVVEALVIEPEPAAPAPRQGARSGGKRRPADVSAAPSDEPLLGV